MLSCLVRCVKMAAKFDEFSISEIMAMLTIMLWESSRIIRDHELDTTTKYALLKAPKDFGLILKLDIHLIFGPLWNLFQTK